MSEYMKKLLLLFLLNISACYSTIHANYIFCDLGGVLIRSSHLQCAQQLGLRNCLSYWWSGESLSALPDKFFRFLDTIPHIRSSSQAIYGPNGVRLPAIMSDWLCGRETHEFLPKIYDALEYERRLYHEYNKSIISSLLEYDLFFNMTQMIFYPEALAASQRLVSSGVSFVKACKRAGHHVYILSNWSTDSFDVLEKTYPFNEFFSLFDGIIISGDVQCAKPDQKIYDIAFQTVRASHPSATAADCLMIDDQLENIVAAQEYGFNTILCTQKKRYGTGIPDFQLIRQKMRGLRLL